MVKQLILTGPQEYASSLEMMVCLMDMKWTGYFASSFMKAMQENVVKTRMDFSFFL